MDVLKDIVQVLATTALLWAGRHPSQLLPPPASTQLLDIAIPTVTIYPPSRCLPLPSYPSVPAGSAATGQILIQTLVLFFGLFIFSLFSLSLGAFRLSLHENRDSHRLHTPPSSEASSTIEGSIERVAEARTQPEVDYLQTIHELSAKIDNLEGQIADKAAEITSLELHHGRQLASTSRDFENQKSQWAAAQAALEVKNENTAADLHAKIARLDQQVDGQKATIEQLIADHQTELQTACSKHHSALQAVIARHETRTTSLASDLVAAQALATRLQTDLDQALSENQLLGSSNARLNELESSQSNIISELKAQLEDQATVNAAEINSLKSHYERQMVSISNDFESQRSRWAAAQRALKDDGEKTVADLRAEIAGLEHQVDSYKAIIEQVNAHHQAQLETERSYHHKNVQALTTLHQKETTSLQNDLVEARAHATRLETELDHARQETQLLKSSKARLNERESIISKRKARLEATSNDLKTAIQEKASAQDRLAAAEAGVKSIGTTLHDALKEHTTVVCQKDDKIAKDAETMNALRSNLAQQRSDWAHYAPQMQRLRGEIATKDGEISTLTSSLASATSRIADLEARNAPNTPATAATQPDVFDDEDARSEVDVEGTTSASPASTAGSLTRSHSMTSLSPTPSPASLRRRHSVNVINERAKPVLEEVATAAKENLGGVVAAEVEQEVVQSAGPESPEPSRNGADESEPVEGSLPEEGLSASMWATSRSPAQHEPPARPDWAAEAATRKGQNGVKSHQKAAQRPRGGPRRQGQGGNRPGFATASFNHAEKIASGKAGGIKTTRNSHKDVRQISREGKSNHHDNRHS